MPARRDDGSAGDVDYAAHALAYSVFRHPDPRIASLIDEQLGDATTVLNVGAGAGSYEPTDRAVTAIEPSASMRAQRPAHLSRAIDAVAESLPFANQSFDAALATFTVHQWRDLETGLREVRRVTRGPIVIMTCDAHRVTHFWLDNYAPEVLETEARRYPDLARIAAVLGGQTSSLSVPIPLDCIDGFNEAYYGRPQLLLNDEARQACSAWSFVSAKVVNRFKTRLAEDLQSGDWDQQNGHLRQQPTYDGSLRLLVATP
ncbi:ubiquinone biosynthesis protein [Planctomyces sp. SCGC AG-212-M04]|nr:ubiquinone biosynthesis protein [Planctomyces sp. SCGC AG-212-M04]